MPDILKAITSGIINAGMKFISVDDKIVRMNFETSSSSVKPIVILPAVDVTRNKLIKLLDNKKKNGIVYNGVLNGVEVSIIQTRMGSPQSAVVMESLRRSNCKVVIRVDFCGGLEKSNIKVGDIIIPKKVFLSDGTSMGYLQKYSDKLKDTSLFESFLVKHKSNSGKTSKYREYPSLDGKYWAAICNEKLYNLFISKATKSVKSRKDLLWSEDAMFCEEENAINTWNAYNCNSVDMESCAIYLLGALFNIPSISILGVSDLPDSEKYCMFKTNSFHPDTLEGLNRAIKFVIEMLPDVRKMIKI
ncbi:MAG: hypothetical protein GY870_04930 [archaeon]|nr:hypothetical protein [archaeon]